jgi:hypothetical protein
VVATAVFAIVLLLAGYLAARASRYYQTNDFFCFWTASAMVVRGEDPYDLVTWNAATGGLYPDGQGGSSRSACGTHFMYPLWTALVVVPFGLLSLDLAATTWMAASILATLFGTILCWRAVRGPAALLPLLGTVVVFSQPFWLLLVGGQFSGLMLGLVGVVAHELARGRDGRAGLALAGLAIKPQLIAVAAPLVLLRSAVERRPWLAGTALGAGATFVILSLMILPGWPLEWVERSASRAHVVGLLPTAWGLGADVAGQPALGGALIAALGAALWVMLRRVPVSFVAFAALAIAVSLFASPYAWSYDYLLLALPWAVVLSRAAAATAATRRALILGLVFCAGFLPWALYALAFPRGGETLSAVIPAANALLVAVALMVRPERVPD